MPVHLDVGSTLRLRVSGSARAVKPAESAPTAVVQPLVIRAARHAGPMHRAHHVAQRAGDQDPNPPIKRYRYTYKELPIGVIITAAFVGGDT